MGLRRLHSGCLWDPSDLVGSLGPIVFVRFFVGSIVGFFVGSLVGFIWVHQICVGPHVTRDTHVGLVARGWLDC